MKKLIVIPLLSFIFTGASYAQVKYKSDHNLHIYRPAGATSFEGNLWMHGSADVRFGEGTHGEYSIEYYDGGLNIFKDYPASNCRRFGFVAQDIQAVFPELISKDANGYLNVDYIGWC